jgi:hypothetical protein
MKLKKTATGMFEMLKSAYDEECLSRTSVCLSGRKGSEKGKSEYKPSFTFQSRRIDGSHSKQFG